MGGSSIAVEGPDSKSMSLESHRLGANTLWYQDFIPSSGHNRLIDHLNDAEKYFFDFSSSWMLLQE